MKWRKNTLKKALNNFYKKLGPGLITGASDDDPSGIATYSQAGAQFGLMTLWMAFFTFPLMISLQEMCSRIGLITGEGLTNTIKKHYPKSLMYFIIVLTVPAIILNIAANLASMGAVAHLIIPLIPAAVFYFIFMLLLTITIIQLSYKKIMVFLKYCCLSLLLYLIIPFITDTNWLMVLKSSVIPTLKFNKEYLNIMVAILGTTISPYMFFWQATMAAEEKKREPNKKSLALSIQLARYDVTVGMMASNIVMYFIILTTGSVLFSHGIHQIDTVEQAAKALEPLAGKFAYGVFALGIIGTGLLSIPVLGACLSYIVSTPFNVKSGLDKKFHQANTFYFIICGSLLLALTIDFIGLSPIKALLWTAVLYGLTAPIMIGLILHIANNKKIMGQHTNTALSNALGVSALILMSLAALLLIYYSLF